MKIGDIVERDGHKFLVCAINNGCATAKNMVDPYVVISKDACMTVKECPSDFPLFYNFAIADYEREQIMNTHDEMIKVIQAHKEGSVIECREHGTSAWSRASYPAWDFYRYEYRVALVEDKLVSHWPGIIQCDQGYILTKQMFYDVGCAKRYCSSIVRLATEYPPIMLKVELKNSR